MNGRPELAALRARLADLEARTTDWTSEQRELLIELRQTEHELQAEAWSRFLTRLQREPAVAGLLRELAGDEFIYAVLRRHGLLKASMDERVLGALDAIRPLLQAHGGDVELVEIQLPDTVVVRMTGACEGCPASAVTLAAGVVRAIRSACPELRTVRDLSADAELRADVEMVSPFVADR